MKRIGLLLLGGFVVLSFFAAYAPVFKAPLLWDDDNFIRKNAAVTTPVPLLQYFTDRETLSSIPRYNVSIYRPWRTLWFSVQHRFFGNVGVGYHVFSFLLHLGSAFLVYLLLWKLFPHLKVLALLFTGLWLLHPAQTEAVSFVSSQGDLWAAFFSLMAMLVLLSGVGLWPYVLTFIVALLSKESAIVLPFVVFFYDARSFHLRSRTFLMGLLVVGLYLLWRTSLLGRATQIDGATNDWFPRLFYGVPRTYLAYFSLLFYPVNQSALYGSVRWIGVEVGIGLACLGVSIAGVYWGASWKKMSLGFVWFVSFLVLVSNIVPISILFAERFVYLASVGLLIWFMALLEPFFVRVVVKGAIIVSTIFLICLCGTLSYRRNLLWADEVALFRDTAFKAPHFKVARINLVQALYERKQFKEVVRELDLYEKEFPMTVELAGIQMESLCELKQWAQCSTTAEALQNSSYADRARHWLLVARKAEQIPLKSLPFYQDYCRRFSSDSPCLTP